MIEPTDNKKVKIRKNEIRLLEDPQLFFGKKDIKHTVNIAEDDILSSANCMPAKISINMRSDYNPCFDFFKPLYTNGEATAFKNILFSYNVNASELKKQGVKKRKACSTCLILVHGFKSKQRKIYLQLAERYARRGIDSLVYTLPFHFERDQACWDDKKTNIRDFRATLELFRQTVVELRILIDFLKITGYEKVGVMGFSFGGYCASLLSCFEKNLDFSIPMASIGDFSSLKIFKAGKQKNYNDPLAPINSFFSNNYIKIICPINYFPVIKTENILFIQGLFDKRAPYQDVARLRNKWKNSRIHWYPCGHFAFFIFNNLTVILTENFIKKIY